MSRMHHQTFLLYLFFFVVTYSTRLIWPDLDGTLYQPPKINLSEIDTLHLYVVKKSVSFLQENEWAINITTRLYCYSTTNDTGYEDDSCSIPGPVLVMRPNTTAKIVLHNYLNGIGHLRDDLKLDTCKATGIETTWFFYKDPDVTNLHVHGLHVSPDVDNVITEKINPFCVEKYANDSDWLDEYGFNCSRGGYGDYGNYTFEILPIHYPGSHWYHAHVHGSVTIQVGGGLYGSINMEPRADLEEYEPQIKEENDHNIIAAWVWLHDNDICYEKLNNIVEDISCNNAVVESDISYTFVDTSRGLPPFQFPIQSLCYINCNSFVEYNRGTSRNLPITQRIYNDTIKGNVSLFYDVKLNTNIFSEKQFRGWLINGQYQPTLHMKTGEWHRIRLVTANMNYLLWSLYDESTGDLVLPEDVQMWLLGNDGVYFETGPRALWKHPFNDTTILSPGSRADILIYGLKAGNYFVYSSNDTSRNEFLSEAPVPIKTSLIMYINITGEERTSEKNFTTCEEWNTTALPCKPQNYSYSPYLTNTLTTLETDNLNSKCTSTYNSSYLSTCAVALQKEGIYAGRGGSPATSCQTSVNGIKYNEYIPLATIPTNITYEWLITSNFHPFHHHTWPFQVQRDISKGWVAQAGDWRDTVGAAGSFTARANYYDYTTGELVVHCHFVPHEDHGMMAWYNLQPYDEFMTNYEPMQPATASQGNYIGDPSNIKTGCSSTKSRYGLSFIDSIDSNTRIGMFINLFGYNNKCYIGILGFALLRPGGVDNAWWGIGLGGSYQNEQDPIANMEGHALVWSMQASDNKALNDLYVKELTLDPRYNVSDIGYTHVKCNNKTQITVDNDTRALTYFYCVRPLTIDFISKINSTSNGFIWAYGEGRFQENRIHAARGVCKITLALSDTYNNTGDYISDSSFNYTYCLHRQNTIGRESRDENNVGIVNETLGDSLLSLTSEDFFEISGYGIPETTGNPTTEEINSPTMSPTKPDGSGTVSFYHYWPICGLILLLWITNAIVL